MVPPYFYYHMDKNLLNECNSLISHLQGMFRAKIMEFNTERGLPCLIPS
jgi:hypothetical protein